MPIQQETRLIRDGFSITYRRFYGNIIINEVIKSIVSGVVNTAANRENCILSNWKDVINVEFNAGDINGALEGAYSIDLMERKVAIAFVLGDNPHLHLLANSFISAVRPEQINAKIFDTDDEGLEWLSSIHQK
ncbi:MAG: hypothetical protein HWE30_07450 [Methylocystaceae bacterium]|nr:hypothetical protein [Methylocystaceae bacterium]